MKEDIQFYSAMGLLFAIGVAIFWIAAEQLLSDIAFVYAM